MPTPGPMTYQRARNLMLLSGLIVVALITLTMTIRNVDPIEIAATLFYAPLFVGLLYFGLPAGIGLGIAASIGYIVLRLPAIQLVGLSALTGLLLSRIAGFLAFGVVGGWAAGRLRSAIDKLERYDEVDDATGLGNARSALHSIETERSRSDRYGNHFSVAIARFDSDSWQEDPGRARAARLQKLGSSLSRGARGSDHLAHTVENNQHLVVAVLPETSGPGAATAAGNLTRRIGEVSGLSAETEVITYPQEASQLDDLVERLRAIDAAERPGR